MPNNNPRSSESTAFTFDNMGRFLSNTAHEALTSAGVDVGIGAPPPDARPFDVIVIGGGTFGSVMAQHLHFSDKTFGRRILVLERGPFVLPEHFQNMSFMGGLPNWVRPWEKTVSGDYPGLRLCLGGRSLEWGGWSPELLDDELTAWPTSVVDALKHPVAMEGPITPLPGYFQQAGEQIASNDTNDFIYGPLHKALRAVLMAGLKASGAGTVVSALPLATWPDHPRVRFTIPPPPAETLRDLLGLTPSDPAIPDLHMKELLRVEAPLAVQSRAEPGQFPVNKFSALPLLVSAARSASVESLPYDQHKRVMVVPNWHVQQMFTQTLPSNDVKVTGVRVARPGAANQPNETLDIPLADTGVVVLAQGTVESTRLAYLTFQNSLSWRAAQRMGKNLVAHLRSNLTIRVPRASIPNLPGLALATSLQVSALFVKGRANVGGQDRYFHLQITASAVPTPNESNSEAELFKKIPDYDNIERLKRATDETVVITLRGIGEMLTRNPDSHIGVTSQSFDFDREKAVVAFGDSKVYAEALANGTPPPGVSNETKLDAETWSHMDALADEVAIIFGGGSPFQVLRPDGTVAVIPAGSAPNQVKAALRHVDRRDGLGTTHHEGGTLRMGDSVADSVTDGFGRIHDTTNCYCAGPALFPAVGSPNPMLTGVALARRTADFLSRRLQIAKPPSTVLPLPAPFAGDGLGWQVLFDGTVESFRRWARVGPSSGTPSEPPSDFRYVDGQILTVGGGDHAVLWYTLESFSDFVLKLQFRVFTTTANSGVFVRMRHPRRALPEPIKSRAQADLAASGGNLAWTAVHSGFEVQIDDAAPLKRHRTGVIYDIPAGDPGDPQLQTTLPGPALVARPWTDSTAWFEYEIRAVGSTYDVQLGRVGDVKGTTATFSNPDAARGVAAASDGFSGFVGVQSHNGSRVAFRNIQVRKL
jgi:3-keto-disaccharide hydrolase/GMC oxidoreductase